MTGEEIILSGREVGHCYTLAYHFPCDTKNMNWMLALENERGFFSFLQKLEKLDRERGEGVRQHALNVT